MRAKCVWLLRVVDKTVTFCIVFSVPLQKFEPFMAPIIAGLERLAPLSTVRSTESMALAIGLARDVRGIVAATHNRPTYLLAFEALYPKHIKTLVRCVEVSFSCSSSAYKRCSIYLRYWYQRTNT
jgi:hypothetical protein